MLNDSDAVVDVLSEVEELLESTLWLSELDSLIVWLVVLLCDSEVVVEADSLGVDPLSLGELDSLVVSELFEIDSLLLVGLD